MSFGNGVKKIVKEIAARYKYVRGKKGILEEPHNELKQWKPDSSLGKVGRVAGLGGIDLTWFLFCLMKYAAKDTKNGLNVALLNNAIIDKWEENKKNIKDKKDDSEFQKFFKNLQKSHPRAASRLQLWMVYALMALGIGGGKVAYDNKEEIKQVVKEWTFGKENKEGKQKETKIIDPVYDVSNSKFKEHFIDKNWFDIVVSLLEFETWHEVPKKQSKEKRQTYGPGLTWVYLDGKQQPCKGKKYINMVANFDEEQIWNQVNQHCLYPGECFSVMQSEFKKYNFFEVKRSQILGLFIAGYQIPSRLKDGVVKVKNGRRKKVPLAYTGIVHRLKDAGDDTQKIVDSFMAGKEVEELWRDGTNKRRWWCAMYYIGKIGTEDLLSMDMDAFSKVHIDTIVKDGHFVFDDETIQYALSQKMEKNGTVQEFIDAHFVLKDKGMIVKNNKKKQENLNNITMNYEKQKKSPKKKSKTIAFNEGILKIKNKQNGNMVVYPFENEYRA